VKRWARELIAAALVLFGGMAIFLILRAVLHNVTLAMDWIPIAALAAIVVGEMLMFLWRRM
jgi:hypothetical protein